MRTARRIGLVLAVCLAALTGPAGASDTSNSGLELVESTQPDGGMVDHRFRTPALGVEPSVRVLLPPGYGKSSRNYPVLYLLHGAIDDYRSLTDKGLVAAVAERRNMILVMPDSGPIGGYANWITPASDGPRRWRDFHLGQLIEWIDDQYRTIGTRSGRAIAGISMGGGGAIRYAALRPDLFGAAASLSGAVDYRDAALREVTPDLVYGPWESEQVRWRGDNPFDLAVNLRPVRLSLHSGNGQPRVPEDPFDPVEFVVHRMSLSLHGELDRLGIPHRWHDYGPAGHTWDQWSRELREVIIWSRKVFASPRPDPRRFSYRTVARDYGVFGWRVRMERRAMEFSRLDVLGPNGLAISGSGRTTVCTPRRFVTGRRYKVRVKTFRGVARKKVRAAGKRLCLRIKLGTANPSPQFTPGAKTRVFAATVKILPASLPT